MEIIELNKEKENIWNDFLGRNKHLIFHTPKYKEFLEKSFPNVKFQYLAAFDNEIKTIFPIGIIKHKMLGNKIISVPFLEYGSFSGDKENIKVILDYIKNNYSKNYRYLEIRSGLDYDEELGKHLTKVEEYKRFVLELKNENENWQLLDKQKRKAIRKAEKNNIIIKELNKDNIEELYNLYLKNMKQFGSPPFYKIFFINFFDLQLGKCFGAFKDNKLISLLLGFIYNNEIHCIIAVSDKKFLDFRPNELVHWHFIKYGINNNFKYFDLGRVRVDSGQFRFKQEFGCQLMPLYHYYDLYKLKNIPKVDPRNAKYRFAVETWRRMPLIMQRRLGPYIREGLGI